MGIGNVVLLSQVTCYLLVFILSMFIFIPMTVNQAEFNGHCLLGAQGGWVHNGPNATVPTVLNVTHWGDSGRCNFTIFVGIATLPLSFFFMIWAASYLFKGREPSWPATFLTLITMVVGALMTIVAGIVVTAGFNTWCALIESGDMLCSMAEFTKFAQGLGVNVEGFYDEMMMAQFGLYASFILWMVLLALAGYQLFLYHQQENFFTSLHRERERLLQHSRRYTQLV